MSNTSQKHCNFVSEPMGEKPVTDLAGIGDVLGKRLEALGFDKVSVVEKHNFGWWIILQFDSYIIRTFLQAYTVLGQYLLLKKDEELFKMWLKDTVSANSKQSADCYRCLTDWCHEFL